MGAQQAKADGDINTETVKMDPPPRVPSAPPADGGKLHEEQVAEPVDVARSLSLRPRTRAAFSIACIATACVASLVCGVVIGVFGARASDGSAENDAGGNDYNTTSCLVDSTLYGRCCAGVPVYKGFEYYEADGEILYDGTLCKRYAHPSPRPTTHPTPVPTLAPSPSPTLEPTPVPSSVPTLTPLPTVNSFMPEDCRDPNIADETQLASGVEHCATACDARCELRLVEGVFPMSEELELEIDTRLYGGTIRPTLTPGCTDQCLAEAGGLKVNGWADPTIKVTLERLRFRDWTHATSGARRIIYVQSGATLEIKDCIFENNDVPMSLVQHAGGGPLIVSSSIFRSNACAEVSDLANSGKGSSIRVTDGSLALRDSIFEENTQHKLGTVYTWNTRNISVDNCTFSSNAATDGRGGALDVEADSDTGPACSLHVRDSHFRANTATDDGAGLYALRLKRVSIEGSFFEGNAAEEDGGGFFAGTVEAVDVEGCTFEGNGALDKGGGLYLQGEAASDVDCALHVRDSLFRDNTAADEGAGLYAFRLMSASVESSSFQGNTAEEAGGFFAGRVDAVDVEGCVFEGNGATIKGGGLYSQGEDNAVRVRRTAFRRNTAGGNAGGAYVSAALATTFSDVEFTDNEAGGNGGAALVGEHESGAAYFEEVRVTDNTAGGSSGGLHIYRVHAQVVDSIFTNNVAQGEGGALSQDAQAERRKSVFIENSTFTSNEAADGGAVAHKQDNATVIRCRFEGNAAIERGDDNDGRGGAVYKSNGARLDVMDSTFVANVAEDQGGAVYATGSAPNPSRGAYVGGCTFNENGASNGGAALASWLEGWFLNASSFSDNVDASGVNLCGKQPVS